MQEELNRPKSDNPFRSPNATESTESTEPVLAAPSGTLVLTCALLSVVVELSLFIYYLGFSTEKLFSYGIISLKCFVYGMGIAWFLHVIRTRQFPNLMPGHWRLIAASTALLTEIMTMVIIYAQEWAPEDVDLFYLDLFFSGLGHLLAAVFYLFVLKLTHERGMWRVYAWLALIYFLLMTLLYPAFIGDFMGPWFMPLLVTQRILTLALFFVCLTAVVNDYRMKTPRDMYHYGGLALGFMVMWVAGNELYQF